MIEKRGGNVPPRFSRREALLPVFLLVALLLLVLLILLVLTVLLLVLVVLRHEGPPPFSYQCGCGSKRKDAFTRTGVILARRMENIQENTKKMIDKQTMHWYTNLAKRRRRCIRLTSSQLGKEVNNVIQAAEGQFVVARVPVWYPRFVIFGTEVFRPLVSKCMN